MSQPAPQTSIPGRIGPPKLAALYTLLTFLVLSPLAWVRVPVLTDYPNHLARIWLLAGGGMASVNYVVHWQWMPNLAMELIVPLLGHLVSIESAGRVFVAVAIVLPVLGTLCLHRTLHGVVGLWPMAAFLFVYNAVLQWGFMNYLFGMGVALLLFSAWVATADWPWRTRLPLFMLGAACLFVLHLFAFGIYGLLVGGYELAEWLRRGWRDGRALLARLVAALQFLPAGVLWLAWADNGGPHYTSYGGFNEKLFALSAPMAFGELGLSLGLMSLPMFLIAWGLGVLRVAPAMRLPILVLLAAAAVMPNWLLGSWGADFRIPVLLPFVLIAASAPAPLDRRLRAGLAALALLLLVARVAGLSANWIEIDRQFSEFRAAIQPLPRGVRLLVVHAGLPGERPVQGMPPLLATRRNTDYLHMPMLAVIDRDAFIPYLFTGWTTIAPAARNRDVAVSQGLPLRPDELNDALRPELRARLEATRDILGAAPYWLDWPAHFDAVLWIDFGQPPDNVPSLLHLTYTGSFFRLYRIGK